MPEKPEKQEYPPGMTLRHTLRGHESEILGLAWSPEGRTLASGSNDQTIRLSGAESGELRQTLKGHSNAVLCVSWSPDGQTLASGSNDNTICLWDAESGKLLRTLEGHSGPVWSVSWSPNNRTLASASGSNDQTIRLWDGESGKLLRTLKGHSNWVNSVSWSPDGRTLASGSDDKTIRLWNAESGKLLRTFTEHSDTVFSVSWSPDGRILASSSRDKTIRLWDGETGRLLNVLEGHTSYVKAVSFSSDGRLLASKSGDSTVRLWHCDTWETITVLDEQNSGKWPPKLAFHPSKPVLATLGEKDTVIRIWDLDYSVLLGTQIVTPSVHYKNAKVVLVGDSGVGKSGLGLVLTGKKFKPTESTHGRHVWTFDNQEVELDGKRRKETRETLLWDLAGQPGYRLIHQLHLDEVAVALVVFDAKSETNPFAGVQHWNKALQIAQNLQSKSAPPMKKFLVAARTDCDGIGVSRERIDAMIEDMGFEGYFETSAKEGWKIKELAKKLRDSVDWKTLPQVSSNKLFQDIKTFLEEEKEAERILSTADDLYYAFMKTRVDKKEDLRAEFDTCVGRLEARGLIRRLSFGGLVLLQPELMDSYASILINAAKKEPQGMGCIDEDKAKKGIFRIPKKQRIKNKDQEKLLLLAMIEDMLNHEIALRAQTDIASQLVFPSQFTRENPELPNPKGKSVIFSFEGPVLNIYTTLIVRLAHSGLFKKKELWKEAALFSASVGGECGLWLDRKEEGKAELTLFFPKKANEQTQYEFEDYVHTHLQRKALPETITRRRIFVCPECQIKIGDDQAQARRKLGKTTIDCNVCGKKKISLLDGKERLKVIRPSVISAMDKEADKQRDLGKAALILQGKIKTGDFDVFLCHNNEDKDAVKEIGNKLKEHGILPWLDEWEIPPFEDWLEELEKIIPKMKAVAVFIGPSGNGPWQNNEIKAFLRKHAKNKIRMGPVILKGCRKKPKVPLFLEGFNWVDFRKKDPDPLKQLIWGITGEKDIRNL